MSSQQGLLDRLKQGETIICGNGYKTELERRGFTNIHGFTSRVVTEFPTQVRQLHEEFVHCGSDVVVACNSHGENLGGDKDSGSEESSGAHQSLKIAMDVANRTGTLMAGRVDATGLEYGKATIKRMEKLLTSQIKMVTDEKADFILGGMFKDTREAKLALECIKKHGKGLPCVMTLSIEGKGKTTDDVDVPEALRDLEELGADVVGLACTRGPTTMMPLMREARKLCKGPLAVIPAAYRTSQKEEWIQLLTDPLSGSSLYPPDLDQAQCNRKDIQIFAEETKSLGIQFVGLCCGAHPSFIREIADIYEKSTPASKFNLNLKFCNIYMDHRNSPTRAKRRMFQLTWEYNKRMAIAKKSDK